MCVESERARERVLGRAVKRLAHIFFTSSPLLVEAQETGHYPPLSFQHPRPLQLARGAVVGVALEPPPKEEAEERERRDFSREGLDISGPPPAANLCLLHTPPVRARGCFCIMPQPPKSSPYRGVTLFRPSGKYRAQVRGRWEEKASEGKKKKNQQAKEEGQQDDILVVCPRE